MNPGLQDLLSGRKRGVLPAIFRSLLSVGSIGYSFAVRLRNLAYDRGWKRIERAAVPVVSLGNLTTGGTGKTPFVAFVARWFRERGVRVCIISRGYGAEAGVANDEARVLERLCPDVPHLQNPDRVAAARQACAEYDSQIILLDDGFQHRRLARDLDIVLIDATNPWGFGRLLPRGLLREPVSALARAGLVVITRVDQVSPETVEAIRREVAVVHPQCGIVEATFPAVKLIGHTGQTCALESLSGASVAAFCGIGNPSAFRASLERLGYVVAGFRAFADHHQYTTDDIDDLSRWSAGLAVDAVLCTQKDLVKNAIAQLGSRPLWAIEIGTQLTAGAELLYAQLDDIQTRINENRS